MGPNPLHIRFYKIDRFIRFHGDEFRHLVLFHYGLFDKIIKCSLDSLQRSKSCFTNLPDKVHFYF